MIINVHDRLTRKYGHAPRTLADPYSEVRDGYLYLVSQDKYNTAILCDAIVSIDIISD